MALKGPVKQLVVRTTEFEDYDSSVFSRTSETFVFDRAGYTTSHTTFFGEHLREVSIDRFRYNAQHDIVSSSLNNGIYLLTYKPVYDENGRKIRERRYHSGRTVLDTQYDYSPNGTLLKQQMQDGFTSYTITFSYDKKGAVTGYTSRETGKPATRYTCRYDAKSNCVFEQYASSEGMTQLRKSYNAQGDMTGYRNYTVSNAHHTTVMYSAKGTPIVYPAGFNKNAWKVLYRYDKHGNYLFMNKSVGKGPLIEERRTITYYN